MGRRKGKAAKPPSKKPEAAPAQAAPRRADPRRWIYGGLDVVFAITQAILLYKVIPNRMPSAAFHLWTLPVTLGLLALGSFVGGPRGWRIAIVGGSAALLSGILLLVRVLISAAFLSGVYGAFGQAALMTGMIAVALVIELVILLPLVQVKYLMSRAGRRAFGVPPP